MLGNFFQNALTDFFYSSEIENLGIISSRKNENSRAIQKKKKKKLTIRLLLRHQLWCDRGQFVRDSLHKRRDPLLRVDFVIFDTLI